jgi:Skp family chaperone for outer membrane proteins
VAVAGASDTGAAEEELHRLRDELESVRAAKELKEKELESRISALDHDLSEERKRTEQLLARTAGEQETAQRNVLDETERLKDELQQKDDELKAAIAKQQDMVRTPLTPSLITTTSTVIPSQRTRSYIYISISTSCAWSPPPPPPARDIERIADPAPLALGLTLFSCRKAA